MHEQKKMLLREYSYSFLKLLETCTIGEFDDNMALDFHFFSFQPLSSMSEVNPKKRSGAFQKGFPAAVERALVLFYLSPKHDALF